ncbi:ornithine cyclodeaminase family protein [Actinoplanes friuliensis]|uniref:Ornithine cyclodeaminase n=2 Tax=Actinoplanes friuliensis TaxID=196914 RepID=U5VYY1_9ACTN|nr:ornithine cyclodeaminase family protein [Actinoplanes friuliensis]AGZ41992.1 ornithine cyclodeaminase [Actinoplanes friuliensis DSM 7358]CAM56775.1 lysine cyclodeaminase [Actinoplanes friuliensis]
MDTLLLTRQHVAKLVEMNGRDHFMDLLIRNLRTAFRAESKGHTPPRGGFLRCPGDTGVIEWMPHHRAGESMTLKLVAYTPSNPERLNLPTIIGTLTRYDDVTGHLEAVSDGVLLTAFRTGAASAVASSLLARPDSRTLGLVGAGAQAVTQAHALSRIFPLERILVTDAEPSHAASYADRVDFLGLDVRVADVEEIERESDIICTATTVGVGAGPVLPGTSLRPDVHINAIGADLVGKFELPVAVLRSATVVPDHFAQARAEGECQQLADDEVGPDLMTLCARPQEAVALRSGRTVFDSTGFALEDHVAFSTLIELAAEAGVGDRVALEHLPEDALNPYS